MVACTAALVGPRAFAGPTSDPQTGARYGAGWLARRIGSSGATPGSDAHAVAVDTANTALALAAAGVGHDAFERAVGYLAAHVDDASPPAAEQPAELGALLLVAVEGGRDPHSFGGVDLVARLGATKQTSGPDTGLFGAAPAAGDPCYDCAFRQSFAVMGLAAAGSGDAQATAWLAGQQCADAGFQSYKPPSTACHPPDLNDFTGEDTNSTALATQALVDAGHAFSAGNPLNFLATTQNTDGGFGFFAGSPTDANSTGLVIQAVVAGGEDPLTGRWVKGSSTPLSALLSLQIGCQGTAADRGAFDFQAETPLKPNALATEQAVPGAMREPFPVTAVTLTTEEPVVDCTPATTTTTAAPATTTTAVAGTQAAGATTAAATPATATSPVASAVAATPTFTG
ncbi:MAG: LPXTG-motif cell wall anchor domain protein [Acidimicrobiales bacterium]|nr:LPXTG-motif cell wall anchor domain protein [Acidimicrobiales bacterium]